MPEPRANEISGTLIEGRLAKCGHGKAHESLGQSERTVDSMGESFSTGQSSLDLILGYADTWRNLLEYDEDRLLTPVGGQPSVKALNHDWAASMIAEFKRELMARNEASELFGISQGGALAAILENVEQTMFGESLYCSREEKAAHLLYFVVKDRPFTDGNKRIGSLLFLLYLEREQIAHCLNPQALTALTLLVAESSPASKDLIIRLIVNLILQPAD